MIGETIKGFQIIQRLGGGGMGEVWAAEQPIIKTRVAIKLLRAEISADQQHVQRFFNEAVAVGKIKHAGIVKIFDVGFHGDRAFLIMELLEGETLASRIARAGRLPIGDAAEIGRQIASILEATHAEGITHRDLKPDNVFLTPDAELASKERVKVLDFGIAKLGIGVTATGDSMGTPAYMAPEQWNNAAQADARSDVYSLGGVVFEMCCGRTPFVAASIGEAYTQHLNVPPPAASSLVPGLPRELDELIARMLSKPPADRPAMRDVGATLVRIAATQPHGLDATMAPATVPRPGAPPAASSTTLRGGAASLGAAERTRSRWLVVAAIVISGVVTAGIVTFTVRRDGTSDRELVRPVPDGGPEGLEAAAVSAEPPGPSALANAWVRIDPPVAPYSLGVPDNAPPEQVGFRASRGIVTPPRPYAIQAHEITWSELDPWLAANDARVEHPPWATDSGARARLPATGITWSMAVAYCRSLGGTLPTEEQWEYAARGPLRRPNPWGADRLDRQMTRAFAGPGAVPSPVMASQQDQTPDGSIFDLAGNVQEWTLGLWREDAAGKDESFAQRGDTTIRAIRGFPLAVLPPAAIYPDAAAYRERLCATRPSVEKTRKLLAYVGLRCVKPLEP